MRNQTVRRLTALLAVTIASAAVVTIAWAAPQATEAPAAPTAKPDATLDLMTREGAAAAKAQWKFAEARIVEAENTREGVTVRTHDIEPRAGDADFNDATWEQIDATSLGQRRTGGKLAFAWYRVALTVPERVGEFDTTGSTAELDVVVDDYAEVWVDGKLPLAVGLSGGQVIAGFNAPNRVVLAEGVKPGQVIQVAIFGINGPLSAPPANFVWFRSATMEFHRPEGAK